MSDLSTNELAYYRDIRDAAARAMSREVFALWEYAAPLSSTIETAIKREFFGPDVRS